MLEEKSKFRLAIGDWSRDGHNQSKDFIFECNASIKSIRAADLSFVKKHEIALHGDGFSEALFNRYEDNVIPPDSLKKLKELGIDFSKFGNEENDSKEGEGTGFAKELYCGSEDVAILFMEMVKTEIKDFKYKMVKDEIPYLNGYWQDGFNFSFGYGTFHN